MENVVARLFEPVNRKPRADQTLDGSPGLYALFLRAGCSLPVVCPGPDGLIYIGKADGAGGLATRCHFNGKTRNHSPRKSLAALLVQTLELAPRRVNARDGSYKTWALEKASEAALDRWMHRNLYVSVVPCAEAAQIEPRLIARFAPPLNLRDCIQSDDHRRLSDLRRGIETRLRAEA